MEIWFGILVAAFIVWFFVMVKHEMWGVALLPAFFPLYLVRFQLGGVPFSLIEVLVYLAFLIFIGRRYKLWKKISSYNFFVHLAVPIGLIVGGVLLALLFQEDPDLFRHGVGILKEWILMPLLYLVMILKIEKDREHLEVALHAYLISCFVLSVWALWQVVSGDYVTIDGRASAIFESANYLALYIGPGVLAAGVLWFERIFVSEWLYRGAYTVVFVVLALALLFSASYAGILAVAFGFLIYFLYKARHLSRKQIAPLCIAIVLLGGVFVISQKDSLKFQNFLSFEEQSSTSARVQIWTVAWEAITDEPIFGIGPGAFQNYYNENAQDILGVAPFDEAALHPHNVFLTFWIYSGALGLVGFVWLVLLMIIKMVNAIRHSKGAHRTLLVMLFSMFLVIVFHGLFDVPFWKNDLSLVWWFVVGSGLSLIKA